MNLKKLPKKLLLKGGKIFDPNSDKLKKSDVLIKKNKIEAIDTKIEDDNIYTIDCNGLIVTHGFCDLHVHFREPGQEDKETLETGSLAALAGGFTRVCAMPNTIPPLDSPEAINFIVDKSTESPIYIHPIGAVTKGQKGKDLTEIQGMIKEGAVAISDDGLPISDAQIMRLALEYTSMFDIPVINHAEDECLRNNGVMNEGVNSIKLGLKGNPSLSESIMVQRDLELANLINTKIHVPHVSTSEALLHIKRMKKNNPKISAEVTPHHLYFNDQQLSTYNTNFKVAPPIRSENNRKALIKGVKDGTIDCIATDHAPHTVEEKEASFDMAPFGMIGLESCFGVINKILGLPINQIIKLVTKNPRAIMSFNNNLFDIGSHLELTIIDPDMEWVFSEKNIYSKSKNSPFLGETLKGKVIYTISKGYLADLNTKN
ncbi:MAG: dihydroorotase [Candidatus Neomarinimicrobiota bacterium]